MLNYFPMRKNIRVPEQCSMPNCQKSGYSRNMCKMHYYRMRRNGTTELAIRRPQNGRYGQIEALVAANLVANGFLVTRMPYNHPFDILLNESTRIEVKTSK